MPEIEKSVCFVYHNGVDASSGQTFPNPVWLNQFEIENRDALNTLSNQYLLDNNTIAAIPETGLKFKYHDGEWVQIKSNCNVESLLEAEKITAQPGNSLTIKLPGNLNSETLIYSGKDFIEFNQSYTAADLNERNSLIVESGDVVHVMNNGENNRQSYLYAEDDWIPFHSGGDSGMINISAQQINITDHGKITTSSENEGNAGNVNIEMSDFLLDNGSEITSESTSGIFGGSAGSINIGGEIVSNDGSYHIVSQGNSVRLKNNSRISTDAVSAGGGKINIQAKDSIYASNSTISTNVKDGTGKGGDINIDPEFVILNHSNISANAIEGDGGAIFIVADHFIKSSDSVIEATSERGNDGTVKIVAPDVDISSGLIKMSSDFLDASQWLRSACGQRSSENISRLIVRGKDAVPVKPDDLHSSPVIVFKDLHLKQSDIKNDITKAEVCYQRGDLESAARIWFDAEKRLKKNSKDYLTTMTYLIQGLQSIGFHNKALALAKKTVILAEKSESATERILFYNTFGDILLSVNELPDAIQYLKIAIKEAKASKNREVMASVMNHVANAVIVDGDINTGIQIYDNALIFLAKSDKTALKTKIYLNLAYVISMAGTYEEALTAFQDAMKMIQSLPDNYDKAFNYISLSQTGMMINNFFQKGIHNTKNAINCLNLPWSLVKTFKI